MTIANWCILIACMLPTASIGIAKVASARLPRGAGQYNNKRPREWADTLQGWQQRANCAQANGFEALPLFIAGVILAQMAHADQATVNQLAMAFIAIRVVYVAAYIANLAAFRTLVWTAGLGVSIALLMLS
ncbi:MAG: MAPEG family protein [Sphingomonadaceae bacterium]